MRLREVGLLITVILLTGSAAQGQGFYSAEESFGAPRGEGLSSLFSGFGFDNTSPFATYGYDTTFSFYREYYSDFSAPIVGGIISTPVKFDISVRQPSRVYFVPDQPVPYTQYASYLATSNANELWVTGSTEWSRYVAAPYGALLQLTGYSPAGGSADFYEIIQSDTGTTIQHRQYPFVSGFSTMSFMGDQPGRHILLFVANSQPSNAVIIDVAPPQAAQQYPATGQGSAYSQGGISGSAISRQASATTGISISGPSYYTWPGSTSAGTAGFATGYVTGPATWPAASGSVSSGSVPPGSISSGSVPPGSISSGSVSPGSAYPSGYATAPTGGDVPVTIQTSLRGYDVYVDNAYVGKQTSPDGTFRFNVVGNQWHTVRIFDGENNYARTMYFQSGVPKIINVPPATTIYL